MRETADVIMTRQTLADSRDPDCTLPNGLRPATCAGNGGRGPGALAGHAGPYDQRPAKIYAGNG